MANLVRAKISALGTHVPPRLLTNADLEKMVETSNQWIIERTGIRQRHIAAPDEKTSDLALAAAREALTAAGLAPAAVDMIVLATTTPDMVFPSTACILQDKLGTRNGPAVPFRPYGRHRRGLDRIRRRNHSVWLP